MIDELQSDVDPSDPGMEIATKPRTLVNVVGRRRGHKKRKKAKRGSKVRFWKRSNDKSNTEARELLDVVTTRIRATEASMGRKLSDEQILCIVRDVVVSFKEAEEPLAAPPGDDGSSAPSSIGGRSRSAHDLVLAMMKILAQKKVTSQNMVGQVIDDHDDNDEDVERPPAVVLATGVEHPVGARTVNDSTGEGVEHTIEDLQDMLLLQAAQKQLAPEYDEASSIATHTYGYEEEDSFLSVDDSQDNLVDKLLRMFDDTLAIFDDQTVQDTVSVLDPLDDDSWASVSSDEDDDDDEKDPDSEWLEGSAPSDNEAGVHSFVTGLFAQQEAADQIDPARSHASLRQREYSTDRNERSSYNGQDTETETSQATSIDRSDSFQAESWLLISDDTSDLEAPPRSEAENITTLPERSSQHRNNALNDSTEVAWDRLEHTLDDLKAVANQPAYDSSQIREKVRKRIGMSSGRFVACRPKAVQVKDNSSDKSTATTKPTSRTYNRLFPGKNRRRLPTFREIRLARKQLAASKALPHDRSMPRIPESATELDEGETREKEPDRIDAHDLSSLPNTRPTNDAVAPSHDVQKALPTNQSKHAQVCTELGLGAKPVPERCPTPPVDACAQAVSISLKPLSAPQHCRGYGEDYQDDSPRDMDTHSTKTTMHSLPVHWLSQVESGKENMAPFPSHPASRAAGTTGIGNKNMYRTFTGKEMTSATNVLRDSDARRRRREYRKTKAEQARCHSPPFKKEGNFSDQEDYPEIQSREESPGNENMKSKAGKAIPLQLSNEKQVQVNSKASQAIPLHVSKEKQGLGNKPLNGTLQPPIETLGVKESEPRGPTRFVKGTRRSQSDDVSVYSGVSLDTSFALNFLSESMGRETSTVNKGKWEEFPSSPFETDPSCPDNEGRRHQSPLGRGNSSSHGRAPISSPEEKTPSTKAKTRQRSETDGAGQQRSPSTVCDTRGLEQFLLFDGPKFTEDPNSAFDAETSFPPF